MDGISLCRAPVAIIMFSEVIVSESPDGDSTEIVFESIRDAFPVRCSTLYFLGDTGLQT